MTAKEKAHDLYRQFLEIDGINKTQAKFSALVVADEIFKLNGIEEGYWLQIQSEIEKL